MNQMGNHNLLKMPVLLAFLFVSFFQVDSSYGLGVCSDNIRQLCDCIYYPFFKVRCSQKSLREYPDFSTIQQSVQILDVSFNYLSRFPGRLMNFYELDTLDLSHNRIESIPDDIILPSGLRNLILSHNNISDWLSLSPNTFLESAMNLEYLSLAENPLGSFNGVDERSLLISGSLKTLDLSDCQIHKISGSLMVSGLLKLENLILRSNPLYTLPDLEALKLTSLDVSACKLGLLPKTVFSRMPLLSQINLSANYRISLVYKNDEYVESESLRKIDLSNCNMNAVELRGFPNLTFVNLKSNLINELSEDTFEYNVLIENLDLSSNAISRVSGMAFQWLKRLRNVDLSLNSIRHIEEETFAKNNQLATINLSRNVIDRFQRFISERLTFLNMSRCEITKIDGDALDDFPELIELDLSNNWFSELPDDFRSFYLQIMDLGRCRLSNIANHTFSAFPELSRLNLAGNRLTTTFRREFFAKNQYLNELYLGDNPWRCECDKNSLEFYQYITDEPSKLKDPSQLLCTSPGNTFGAYWEVACRNYWNVASRRASTFERVWTIGMAVLIIIALLYATILGVRWWNQHRKEAREEQQRQENLQTTRELMRHNQMVLEQESQLNAPDPRETHPPCYADAILLPKPQTSMLSLKSNDSDSSLRRAKKRAQSEEFLSTSIANKSRRLILAAKSRTKRLQASIGNIPENKTLNNLPKVHDTMRKSFEIIKYFETEGSHSPYAQRKPQPIVGTSSGTQPEMVSEPIYANEEVAAGLGRYHSDVSLANSNHSNSSFTSHNSFTTSSTSSYDSDNEYYLRLSHYAKSSDYANV